MRLASLTKLKKVDIVEFLSAVLGKLQLEIDIGGT